MFLTASQIIHICVEPCCILDYTSLDVKHERILDSKIALNIQLRAILPSLSVLQFCIIYSALCYNFIIFHVYTVLCRIQAPPQIDAPPKLWDHDVPEVSKLKDLHDNAV